MYIPEHLVHLQSPEPKNNNAFCLLYSLSHIGISDDGVSVLSEMLKENRSLEELE